MGLSYQWLFKKEKLLVFLIRYPFIIVGTQRHENLSNIFLCLKANHIPILDESVQYNFEIPMHICIRKLNFFDSWNLKLSLVNFTILRCLPPSGWPIRWILSMFCWITSSSILVFSFSLERTSFSSSLSFSFRLLLFITKHGRREYWACESLIRGND